MSEDAIHLAIVEDDAPSTFARSSPVWLFGVREFAALDRPLLVAATNGPRRIDCG